MRKIDAVVGKVEVLLAISCFSAMSIIKLVGVFNKYALNNRIIW